MIDPNEAQGRIILARGLASQEQVHRAWQAASAGSGDLCAALQSWGFLDPARAAEVRAEARGPASTLSRSVSRAGSSTPTIVGGHRILGELSRGGMGVVFRAEHKSLKVPLALKLLLTEKAGARARARFEREARAMLALNHPNVVRLLDYGEDGGRPFLAMELIAGRSLQAEVEEGFRCGRPTPLKQTLTTLKTIAEALAAGHRSGLVHRDLKPSNIMIEAETGRPVLIDYGLVRGEKARGEAPSLTGSGDVMGTPSYMAPEQFDPREFGKVGAPADVWALGGVLFFCLTGRAPFEGSPLSIFNKILSGERPKLSELRKAPLWLEALGARCFELEPAKRIGLDFFLAELEARSSSRPARPGRSGPPPRRRPRRRPALAVLGLAVLALAALVFGALSLEPAPSWVAEPRVPDWTSAPSLELAAKLDRAGRVRVERAAGEAWASLVVLEADADGRLAGRVSGLSEGENRLRFVIEGSEAEAVERRVGRDSAPPRLVFLDAWRGALPHDGGRLLLRARLVDAGPCRLEINGQAMTRAPGLLALTLDPGGSPSLPITVTDRAGLSESLSLSLVSRERFERCRALQDRVAWKKASPELQRRICLELVAELGEGFAFVDLKRFACGGEEHRIGRLLYRPTGSVLHLIPGGTFLMGNPDPDGDHAFIDPRNKENVRLSEASSMPNKVFRVDRGHYDNELPAHEVRVPAFLMAWRELSFGEWIRGGGEAPKSLAGRPNLARLPVILLSWKELRLGLAERGFRLPSEAEWEYACRAGTTSRYYWGNEMDDRYVRGWKTGRLGPQPVGGREAWANAFGLEDMCGNVAELCEDGVGGYQEAPTDGSPRLSPVHPDDLRVLRGGGWQLGGAFSARSSFRGRLRSEQLRDSVGLRVARSLPPSFDVARPR